MTLDVKFKWAYPVSECIGPGAARVATHGQALGKIRLTTAAAGIIRYGITRYVSSRYMADNIFHVYAVLIVGQACPLITCQSKARTCAHLLTVYHVQADADFTCSVLKTAGVRVEEGIICTLDASQQACQTNAHPHKPAPCARAAFCRARQHRRATLQRPLSQKTLARMHLPHSGQHSLPACLPTKHGPGAAATESGPRASGSRPRSPGSA